MGRRLAFLTNGSGSGLARREQDARGGLPARRRGKTQFARGHRALGATHWFASEYVEARGHLERALTLFQPGREDDLAFRFGWDADVAAMVHLAITLWELGDIERAVSLVSSAEARVADLAHIGTQAYEKMNVAMFELMRGDLLARRVLCRRTRPTRART